MVYCAMPRLNTEIDLRTVKIGHIKKMDFYTCVIRIYIWCARNEDIGDRKRARETP